MSCLDKIKDIYAMLIAVVLTNCTIIISDFFKE